MLLMILEFFLKPWLVKSINSKSGKPHFRRWAFKISADECRYLHWIGASDTDVDPHNHGWNFTSWILLNGYSECVTTDGKTFTRHVWERGDCLARTTDEYHKIQLFNERPCITWVRTGPYINSPWGYMTEGGWLDHKTYRDRKRLNDKYQVTYAPQN